MLSYFTSITLHVFPTLQTRCLFSLLLAPEPPTKKVKTSHSRGRPKLYPRTISADPSCGLCVSSWPEVRGCPHRLESDILLISRRFPRNSSACLPLSIPLGQALLVPLSASLPLPVISQWMSVCHTLLLLCRFHLHILALWEGFSTHPPSPSCIFLAPTTPVSPDHSSPRSPRNHPENMGKEHQQSAAMNRGSRKWSQEGKPGVWSRRHLPLCICPLVLGSNTHIS